MKSVLQTKKIKSSDILKLKRLFKKALYRDFAYFPGDYLETVDRQNSLFKLIKASLDKNRQLMGLYEDKKLVGYTISDASDPNEAFIFWVYIKPNIRGGGYGRKLVDQTIEGLKEMGVANVYLMTQQFEDFYKSMGFDTIHKNNKLFEDITMYEMAKELDFEKKA